MDEVAAAFAVYLVALHGLEDSAKEASWLIQPACGWSALAETEASVAQVYLLVGAGENMKQLKESIS